MAKSNTSIQYCQEFHFADHLTRHWAFEHPDNWATWQSVAELTFPDRRWYANVLTNTGEIFKTPLIIENFVIKPNSAFKTSYVRVGLNYETRYLIRGSSINDPEAVWITEADFKASDDVAKIAEELQTALQKFAHRHFEELRRGLAKSAPEISVRAKSELPIVIKAGSVLSWFTSNGFNAALKEEDFKAFKDMFVASGILVSTWTVSEPERHVTVTIDWHKKKVNAVE